MARWKICMRKGDKVDHVNLTLKLKLQLRY